MSKYMYIHISDNLLQKQRTCQNFLIERSLFRPRASQLKSLNERGWYSRRRPETTTQKMETIEKIAEGRMSVSG
jgi:hypothetical protein